MAFFRVFCSVILLSVATSALAQSADTTVLKQLQLKLNAQLTGLGFSAEQRLDSKVSFSAEGGFRAATGLYYSRFSFSKGIKFWMPFVGLESRYYYNFAKRAGKGKATGNNSANFVSLGVLQGFNPDSNNPDNYGTTTIMPTWGIQRKAGKHLSLEFNAGLSINYFDDEKEWVTGPAIGFKLGYVIR